MWIFPFKRIKVGVTSGEKKRFKWLAKFSEKNEYPNGLNANSP